MSKLSRGVISINGYKKPVLRMKPNNIVEMAHVGDAVLHCINRKYKRIIDTLNLSGEVRGLTYTSLESNKFLSKFTTGFKNVKDQSINHTSNSRHSKEVSKKACLTEAWIYFLWDNYGVKSAERYIEKQIIRVIKEYYIN